MGRATLRSGKMLPVDPASLVDGNGERKGHFVWWSLRDVAWKRDDLQHQLELENLDPEVFMPPEIVASSAFRKAVDVHKSKTDYRILPIKLKGNDRVKFGVYNVETDEDLEDNRFDTISMITWHKNTEAVTVDGEVSELTSSIMDTYHVFRETHVNSDIRSMLTSAIGESFAGAMVRDGGGIYFVAEPYSEMLIALRSVVRHFGSKLYLVPIHKPGDMAEAARDTLEDNLQLLEQEVVGFQENLPRGDTLSRRLEEYQALKQKLVMYSSMLGFRSEDLSQKADDLDAVVTALLTKVEEEKAAKAEARKSKKKEDTNAAA